MQDRKYDFLFDTGAESTFLNDDIPTPEKEKGFATINNIRGKNFIVKRVAVDTLLIGSVAFYNLAGYIKGPLNGMDGILGSNIIQQCAWKFDFASRQVYVAKDGRAFDTRGHGIPLKIRGNKTYVHGKVNDVAIEFLLDFGFDGFAHIGNQHIDSARLNTISTDAWYGQSVQTSFDSAQAIHLDTSFYSIGDLTIGNQSLENELIASYYFQKTSLLGMDFFSRFNYVVLDYPNKMLYLGEKLHKSTRYMEGMKRINTTGVLLTYDTVPRVQQVLFSLMKDQDIKPTDTVVEINDVSFLDREPSFYNDTVYHLYDSVRQIPYTQEIMSEFKATLDIFHHIRDTSTIKIKKGDGTKTIHLIRQYHHTALPDTVQQYVVPSLFLYENATRFGSDSSDYFLFKTYKLPPHAYLKSNP